VDLQRGRFRDLKKQPTTSSGCSSTFKLILTPPFPFFIQNSRAQCVTIPLSPFSHAFIIWPSSSLPSILFVSSPWPPPTTT
jgi:hypothetical protein